MERHILAQLLRILRYLHQAASCCPTGSCERFLFILLSRSRTPPENAAFFSPDRAGGSAHGDAFETTPTPSSKQTRCPLQRLAPLAAKPPHAPLRRIAGGRVFKGRRDGTGEATSAARTLHRTEPRISSRINEERTLSALDPPKRQAAVGEHQLRHRVVAQRNRGIRTARGGNVSAISLYKKDTARWGRPRKTHGAGRPLRRPRVKPFREEEASDLRRVRLRKLSKHATPEIRSNVPCATEAWTIGNRGSVSRCAVRGRR